MAASKQNHASSFCHVMVPAETGEVSKAIFVRVRDLGFDAIVVGGWRRDDIPALARRAKAHHLAFILDLLPENSGADVASLSRAVSGFRCEAAHTVDAGLWRSVISEAHENLPATRFLAFTFGAKPEELAPLTSAGFDAAASSSCWWDFRAGWLDEDADRVGAIGDVVALTVPLSQHETMSPRGMITSEKHRALILAAHYAPLWLTPLSFCDGVEAEIIAVNAERRRRPELFAGRPARIISPPGAEVTLLVRGAAQAPAFVLAFNPERTQPAAVEAPAVLSVLGEAGGTLRNSTDSIGPGDVLHLGPSNGEVLRFVPSAPIRRDIPTDAGRAASLSRIAIREIRPAVENGRWPAKRIVGEEVPVEANVICDGHGRIGADLLWRPADADAWQRVPMQALPNDRFIASIPLDRIGRYLFTIEAWLDRFGSLLDDIEKKRAAGAAVDLEVNEAIALIQSTAREPSAAPLAPLFSRLEQAPAEERLALLTAPETFSLMRKHAMREFCLRREPPLPLEAERHRAGFASWYELFPRSQSGDPERHGTFADVIARLPAIRDMGFDVLYFPPIHPIGRVHRKGRNNALNPAPEDPGSPYAIGSDEGGHEAIHPELGTLADFHRLQDAATRQGIEIALDFAIQCAPDHPWIRAHPEWFEWRPDGSIRYAENPPKRYEDIVNVAFHAPGAAPSLWHALNEVIRFWMAQGIRIFRVDNPHTKPLPFWEWLIEDIRSHDPDVIFLAEAFTRPAMMYRLAQIGFSQSYTYFTWRNTKYELTSYFSELGAEPVVDFFRPNLFVNTPDINPFYLQEGGRPAFLVRAALAATLSGLWGVYNGFELCEARALPGREEYLDSEKYQIRAWDWDRPGNIKAEIARLNQIRRDNPGLRNSRGTEFLNAFHDEVLYYARTSDDGRNTLLVAVNLNPHRVAEAEIEIPLWRFGLADDAEIGAEELMGGEKRLWRGKLQRLRLDPHDLPFAIWRLDRHDWQQKDWRRP